MMRNSNSELLDFKVLSTSAASAHSWESPNFKPIDVTNPRAVGSLLAKTVVRFEHEAR